MKVALGILLGALVLFVQLPIVPGWDISRIGMDVICTVGILGGVCIAITRKMTIVDAGFFAIPVLFTLLSSWRWIMGYTEYQLLPYFGMAGISMIAMRADIRPVAIALCIAVFAQVFFRNTDILQWAVKVAENDKVNTGWGALRHRIRYATVMFAGICGAWYLMAKKRKAN